MILYAEESCKDSTESSRDPSPGAPNARFLPNHVAFVGTKQLRGKSPCSERTACPTNGPLPIPGPVSGTALQSGVVSPGPVSL